MIFQRRAKPRAWITHNFAWILIQIRTPPTERAVCNDVVVAHAHEKHLLPVIKHVLDFVKPTHS